MVITCENCRKQYEGRSRYTHCYCSEKCHNESQDKKVTLFCKVCNKAFKVSPSRVGRSKSCSVKCFRISRRKGMNGAYVTKHTWIVKNWGKPNHCENCGIKEIPKGMKRYFEWSNKDHKYGAAREDWQQLCILCHRRYDIALHKNGSV